MDRFWKLVVCALLTVGCSAPVLVCESVEISYWQKAGETEYPYRVSYKCIKADGTKEVVTPITSATKLPTGCTKTE